MKNKVLHINLKLFSIALLAFIALGSSVVTAQSTQWVGSVSTVWDNAANWNNGVPNSTRSAVIKSATFAPTVPATGANVLDVDIQAGGTLNFASGSILTVYGTGGLKNTGTINLDGGQIIFKQNVTLFNGGVFNAQTGTVQMNGGTWQNNSGSTFNPGTSTFIFDGTANQTIIGDMTFYNVIFTSAGTITAQGNINVLNDATIDAGTTLDMGTFTLDVQGTFTNNGTATVSRPYITAASTPSLTQVDVTFSENLDQTSAETASNYAIDQGITVSSAQRDATNNAVVHLTVSTLTIATEYTLTVNQVKDLAGNSVSTDHKKRFIAQLPATYYSRTNGNWNTASTWSNTSHTGAAASTVPGSVAGDLVIIGNSNTITLDVNVSNLTSATVNSTGMLNTGTFVISGTGTFTLNSGGTLGIGSADGITSSGASGNIQVTGTRTYDTGANYTYDGSASQATGNGLPSTVNNLTINNSGGTVTLTGSVAVSATFALTQGTVAVGSNTLTLNGTVTSGGTLTSGTTGTVSYNQSSAGQTVLAASYGNLTFSNFNKTLPSGTVGIAGTFTPGSATVHTVTGNTIDFNGTGAQNIPTFNGTTTGYNNLTTTGNGSTKTVTGDIRVGGTFTNGAASNDVTTNVQSNTLTIVGTRSQGSANSKMQFGGASNGLVFTTGIVEYNGTNQTITGASDPSTLYYASLLLSNSGTKTVTGATSIVRTTSSLSVSSGITLSVSSTGDLRVEGNLTNNGSVTNDGTITVGN